MAVTVSRRRAREGAMRALYEIDLGKTPLTDAIEYAVIDNGLSHDLADYMDQVVRGVYNNRREIDPFISRYLKEYDLTRLLPIDRAILRIATYELLYVPEMPPAVTINEAIEISRRYSTAESGKFINGVLGRLIYDTPKAKWDPATAPAETREDVVKEPEPEIEEEVVQADTPEGKNARRYGWVLKSGEKEIPPVTD